MRCIHIKLATRIECGTSHIPSRTCFGKISVVLSIEILHNANYLSSVFVLKYLVNKNKPFYKNGFKFLQIVVRITKESVLLFHFSVVRFRVLITTNVFHFLHFFSSLSTVFSSLPLHSSLLFVSLLSFILCRRVPVSLLCTQIPASIENHFIFVHF